MEERATDEWAGEDRGSDQHGSEHEGHGWVVLVAHRPRRVAGKCEVCRADVRPLGGRRVKDVQCLVGLSGDV